MLTPLTMGVTLTDGRYERPLHLRHLDRLLMEVAAGRVKRLLVTMPPRQGKSEACSHWFPTWLLAVRPDTQVILASYEATFAASWGRRVRDGLIAAHQAGLCPARVRSDVSAAAEWRISGHEGGMRTAGVGGGITGYGANLLIIDDPVKNAEEANSATYREKAWEWYQSTAYTRLEPDGAVVLIMTRWHQDDLAGRLLEREPGAWEVLNLPALAEENDPIGREVGEALWPERYPVSELEAIRESLGSYWWQALYQQRPTPRGGGMIPAERITVVDRLPQTIRSVRFWDLAGTEGGGDWTAGVRMGLLPNGAVVVEDVCHVQKGPNDTRELVRQTAQLDGHEVAVYMEQEPGQSGKDQIASYRRDVLAGYSLRGIRATGDKVLRADPFAAAVEAGNVYAVRGAWNSEYLSELEEFPHGAHDDQVDASSGAYGQLTGQVATGVIAVPKREVPRYDEPPDVAEGEREAYERYGTIPSAGGVPKREVRYGPG